MAKDVRKSSMVLTVTSFVFVLALALNVIGGGNISGAIFTTNPDGSFVNENVKYESKIEVYLEGGPPANAPASAAGLDAGKYVFQITDPSGKILLSEDPAKCRIVEASSDGVFIRLVPPSELGFGLSDDYTVGNGGNAVTIDCHIADSPTPPYDPSIVTGVAGPSGQHDTNMDVDHGSDKDAIVVQLMPFLDTPNPGGVYKAWVTPLDAYLANGNLDELPKDRGVIRKRGNILGFNPDEGFGPPRGSVKTDNFKVIEEPQLPSTMLHVLKFHDLNANGIKDENEPYIGDDENSLNKQCVEQDGTLDPDCDTGGGWPIFITDPTFVINQYFTPVWIISEPAGDYIIEEGQLPNWQQSVAFIDAVSQGLANPVTVSVAGSPNEEHVVLFGNYLPAEIHGTKYIDLNANGQQDEFEGCPALPDSNNPGCEGVAINLDGVDGMGSEVHLSTTTDSDGDYWFMDLKPGSYTVTVTEPAGFICSGPSSCQYDLNLTSGQVSEDNDFGDFLPVDIHAHKFHDRNLNGVQDFNEEDLSNVEFCLFTEDNIPVTTDAFNNPVETCQLTNGNGLVWWMGLLPGHYIVNETVPLGFSPTTPTSVIVWLDSGEDFTIDFGNVQAVCNGLTPGYWKNWRNHYRKSQMKILLVGTIAPTIAEADAIFAHWDASPGDELTILRAMLLANQLTLSLTQNPQFPNPSDGSLFNFCEVSDNVTNLGEIIELALEIHNADGIGFSRSTILYVAAVLDAFANLNNI